MAGDSANQVLCTCTTSGSNGAVASTTARAPRVLHGARASAVSVWRPPCGFSSSWIATSCPALRNSSASASTTTSSPPAARYRTCTRRIRIAAPTLIGVRIAVRGSCQSGRDLPQVERRTFLAAIHRRRGDPVPPKHPVEMLARLASSHSGAFRGTAYELQGVRQARPEIAVDRRRRGRHPGVDAITSRDAASLMIRLHRGVRLTGPEATLVRLAQLLDDRRSRSRARTRRRRRLTSVPALRAYVDRWGASGRPGVNATRALLAELDPVHAARSTLEMKTRRLLVDTGYGGFIREIPSNGTADAIASTSRSSGSGRFSRPTAAAGTMIRPTTSTTTRSGACPAGTASSSCSRPGRR